MKKHLTTYYLHDTRISLCGRVVHGATTAYHNDFIHLPEADQLRMCHACLKKDNTKAAWDLLRRIYHIEERSMIYKRATAQLRQAGIDHIVIVKRLWGPAPEDPRLKRQSSRCFKTWQSAVEAVKDGFRPTEGSAPA